MAMAFDKKVARGSVPEFVGRISTFCGLEQGDIFTIPAKMEVMCDSEYPSAQFIYVVNQRGEAKRLYPSQFTRRVRSKNGRIVTASGSAVEMFKSFETINDAMHSLCGKTIKVSNETTVKVNNVIYKKVYTFDFV